MFVTSLGRTIDGVFQDLGYGWRLLRRAPSFTAVAVLTLALGVGATVAVFSVVNAVLLRPLPFHDAEQLVRVTFDEPGAGIFGARLSVTELNDLRQRPDIFADVVATARGSVNLSGGSQPQRLEFVVSSPEYFTMLGVRPQIGRVFGAEDRAAGFAPAAVISDRLWRDAFGADPTVIGRTVRLDIDAYVIVGVLPAGFRHPGTARAHDVDVWLTSGFQGVNDPAPTRSARILPGAIGRLAPGLSVAQAQARLTALAADLRGRFPSDYPASTAWTVDIQSLQDAIVGGVRPLLLVLLGAVVAIVGVVSLNVANLLLARASGRTQEMAVRAALGASRARLVVQMLAEAVLLAVIGGATGVATALGTLRLLVRAIPPTVPRVAEIRIDGLVLSCALGVTCVTALVIGIAPALAAGRLRWSAGLQDKTRGSSDGARTRRWRDALMVTELALAMALMVGAGLLLRTVHGLLTQDPGFNPAQVVAANVNLPRPNDPALDAYGTVAQQTRFFNVLQARLDAISGVDAAAVVSDLPSTGLPLYFGVDIDGQPSKPGDERRADDIVIGSDYFRVMQVPVLHGRAFTDLDVDGSQRVAIVDQSTARRYWPDRDAVGRRLRVGQSAWLTVVGVVGDTRHDGLDVASLSHVYVPAAQPFDPAPGVVFRDFAVVLRTPLAASALEQRIRGEVQRLDPSLPVYSVMSMTDLLDRSVAARRLAADLVSGFAGASLGLAAIGIYGLLAFMVGQRSREIGLRLALGATRRHIVALVMGRGVLLGAIGIAIGMALAGAVASSLTTVIYGVRPHDPVVFVSVAGLLVAMTLAASYAPAWRATRVDPMRVLRE